MKVSSTDTFAKITRQLVITEGNPVVHMAYSNPPKKVIVDKVIIEYTWQDGRWVVKDRWAVDVVGDVLKKDDTRSKNTHKRDAAEAPNSWLEPEYVPHETWAWIQPIIELLRPNGDLSMMVLNEAEVG